MSATNSELNESQNYAIALFEKAYTLSEKAHVEDPAHNLRKAIDAYIECLDYTPPSLISAGVYHNIGLLYIRLDAVEPDIDHLNNAINAFHEALHYRTPQADIEGFIESQMNLANCYQWLAQRGNPHVNLLHSLEAHLHLLQFCTPDEHGNYYSDQMNLGNVYHDLSKYQGHDENLKAAIVAYRKALDFYEPDHYPLGYALVNLNMGMVYKDLTEIQKAEHCWQEAATYFEQVDHHEDAEKMRRWITELHAN
jgi:tetratricopeptide (TPR) repeat protein